MVLATDMANHTPNMNVLKQITEKIDQHSGAGGNQNNQFHMIEEEIRTASKVFILG